MLLTQAILSLNRKKKIIEICCKYRVSNKNLKAVARGATYIWNEVAPLENLLARHIFVYFHVVISSYLKRYDKKIYGRRAAHTCTTTTILTTCTMYPRASREVTYSTGRVIDVFARSKILEEGELSLCCEGTHICTSINISYKQPDRSQVITDCSF